MRTCFSFISTVFASIGLFVSSTTAADPTLTGNITLSFQFEENSDHTGGTWNYTGESGSLLLTVPAILNISAVPGPGTLNWAQAANWTTFPLDTSGFSISVNGGGTYSDVLNNGSSLLNVLGGIGPTESTAQTNVQFTSINGDPSAGFSVFSNTVATHFDVTLPTGAHLSDNQFQVSLHNFTVNSGASVTNGTDMIVQNNVTNHGSGDFGGTVQGNFINDALSANGDVANSSNMVLQGQLQNTGELQIGGSFETKDATSNAGKISINSIGPNGGNFKPDAAFANNGTIVLSSGNLNGPGVVTNNGVFQWTGSGSINGSLVNTTTSFTITGAAQRLLFGSLSNAGTITQSGDGDLQVANGGTLTNQASGLYDITDDSTLSNGFNNGFIENDGTFRKSGVTSGGTGVSTIGPAFTNTGTIRVTSGTLSFTGGGSLNGGTMSFSGGSTIQIAGGADFSVQGSNTAAGNGTLSITSGKVVVSNGNSGSFTSFTGGANLVVSGGTLRGDQGGTLTLNLTGSSSVQLTGSGNIGGAGTTINSGNFQWTGGTVSGNLSNSSTTFTISGGQESIFGGGTLSNSGTISQSGKSDLQIGNGSTLANQSGALFDILDDSTFSNGFNGGFITNAGTFRKSGGTGNSTIAVPFTNTGTISVNTGKLTLSGQSTLNLPSTSILDFKLSGETPAVDYGLLNIPGTLVAAGTLHVSLNSGFMPVSGDSFDLLDWGTLNGKFSNVQLPNLTAPLGWDTSQLYTSGIITATAFLPGDINRDGKVNVADISALMSALADLSGYKSVHSDLKNNPQLFSDVVDVNGDGKIDNTDLQSLIDLVTNNGANGSGGSAVIAVPEPTSIVLLGLGALAIAFRRRSQ